MVAGVRAGLGLSGGEVLGDGGAGPYLHVAVDWSMEGWSGEWGLIKVWGIKEGWSLISISPLVPMGEGVVPKGGVWPN